MKIWSIFWRLLLKGQEALCVFEKVRLCDLSKSKMTNEFDGCRSRVCIRGQWRLVELSRLHEVAYVHVAAFSILTGCGAVCVAKKSCLWVAEVVRVTPRVWCGWKGLREICGFAIGERGASLESDGSEVCSWWPCRSDVLVWFTSGIYRIPFEGMKDASFVELGLVPKLWIYQLLLII
jgi:hypothetical protein